MNTFSYLFLFFLAASFTTQLWLSLRQGSHVSQHRAEVPDAFQENISLEDHQKAADYTLAKGGIGRLELIWGSILLLGWTLGGGIDFLDHLLRDMAWTTEWTGAALFISMLLISGLLGLPFELYQTFVIEERFGFNRTNTRTYILDKLKGLILMMVLGLPLLWVILSLMEHSGSNWWLYVWMVWTGFMLLMLWAYPSLIAPMFNKFTPLDDETLKERIESLLSRCGFTSKGLFVMDGSKRSGHGNAYFTGFGNNKRIVFFDTLLKGLEPDEVEAVLAHELGHFHHQHVRIRLIVSILTSLASLALLGWLINQTWFYTGLGVETASSYMALLLFMLIAPVFTFFLGPISSALSRRHEFQADVYAAEQASAQSLVHALVKMYRDNASTLTPDPLYSAFYDSHPPAPIRIAHLDAL